MRDDLIELIEVTRLKTRLTKSIVEKDYFVTRLLNKLSQINNEHFKLVFAGGTCLAKAHRITKRMSEDADFKVQQHTVATPLTKSKYRVAFRKLREQIVTALKDTEFKCTSQDVQGHGTHAKINVDYPVTFPEDKNIRPHIQLELSLSEIKLPTHRLSIKTLIEDIIGNKVTSDSCILECVSIEETAAEKWVALTRRIAETSRNPHKNEDNISALVRHIYDLFIIARENKLGKNFIPLSKEIILIDKEKYKSQHREYHNSPASEINYSLELLQDRKFTNYYDAFIESLVYDEQPPLYRDALKLITKISSPVINELS